MSQYNWTPPPSYPPLQQQQTQLIPTNVIWTTGSNSAPVQPYNYGSISAVGTTFNTNTGYIPLVLNGPNGNEVLRIDPQGDIITMVADFDNLKRIRITDHIQNGNEVISLWDELYDKPGIKNTGRSLILPEGIGRVIKLYLAEQGYAGMSLGEFVEKAAGLRKNRKTKPVPKKKKARRYKK